MEILLTVVAVGLVGAVVLFSAVQRVPPGSP